MKNKFLYNKYKPLSLKDFIGQKEIISIVKYLIRKKNVPCNYIFYGPKGTGKTSFSRIFFKLINCSKNFNKVCTKNCLCKKNFPFKFDFLEIDAASNRKVEEIKEILKFKEYVPVIYKYRTICIDEAQMLSNHSFNFLLKCIEESNKNFIIIFITTNFKKIPETIVSRCMCLEFKKVEKDLICEKLIEISQKENINFEKKALELISNTSDGSVRNALVTLDKIVALTNNNVSYIKTLQNTSLLKKTVMEEIISLLLENNRKKLDFFISSFKDRTSDFCEALDSLYKHISKKIIFFFRGEEDSYLIKKMITIRDCISREIFFLKGKTNNFNNFYYVILKCFLKINA
ncbi:DNA polymerase III subunit gamma [Candidatus Vidania fulgoroideae]|nr:DNA polymerase III subunit gamma [Candidatus Vidania fulgoroideae]